MRWSTSTSLVLAGDSINEWIRLLSTISFPKLKHLEIHGTIQVVAQELSHSSVLFVQELICAGALAELRLQDIQLQDMQDWVPIIESKGPSLSLNLCKRSDNQLKSCTEAMDVLEPKGRERRRREGQRQQRVQGFRK